MDCTFTGFPKVSPEVSRPYPSRRSKPARKTRRRRIAAAAGAAPLQAGEETSSTAVVQAADNEHLDDCDYGSDLDGEYQQEDISRRSTVQLDDLHRLENQHPERQSAADEDGGVEVKSISLFLSAVGRVRILTYSL